MARDIGGGNAMTTVTLEVKDLYDLQLIINRIQAISGVSEVSRNSN